MRVTVSKLTGESIEFTMAGEKTVRDVKAAVSQEWAVQIGYFHLIHEASIQTDTTQLADVASVDQEGLQMQLIMFDPMPDLGQFVGNKHAGIEIRNGKSLEHRSSLVKIRDSPDSNNVLLAQKILQPCFVEFEASSASDEMIFGVTDQPEKVERVSGFSNMRLQCIWSYAKHGSQSPTLQFGAKRINGVQGFRQGDRVAVFVDPLERQVKFFRNGKCVADNLPEHPLPEVDESNPLQIYALVDYQGDKVQILSFGPGEPYRVLP